MASTTLLTTQGARLVMREELLAVKAPEATATWFPLSHGQIVTRVEQQLQEAGFQAKEAKYALSRGDHRFFALCQAWHNANCAEC
jgi:hypothetical protein